MTLLDLAHDLMQAVGQVEKTGHQSVSLDAGSRTELPASRPAPPSHQPVPAIPRSASSLRQPVPTARRLVTVAAWFLPARQQARYAEEYRSELGDLATKGAGRRQQLGHAVRLLVRASRGEKAAL
jgi:hypothetical protein